MSTSATEYDPRARPNTNRPNPAHRTGSRPPAQLFPRMATLIPTDELPYRSLSSPERSQSRVHGSGAVARVLSPHKASAPPIAIARERSFAPTRSTRTPLVANSWRRGLEYLRRRAVMSDAPVFSEPARRSPLTRRAPPRAASRAIPRRIMRSAAPEVPSIVGYAPSGAVPSPSTTCPQPVESSASAFSIFVRP